MQVNFHLKSKDPIIRHEKPYDAFPKTNNIAKLSKKVKKVLALKKQSV
jgi:hypothetical protein